MRLILNEWLDGILLTDEDEEQWVERNLELGVHADGVGVLVVVDLLVYTVEIHECRQF